MGILPLYFTKNAMPSMNDSQLEYRITHVSLETMCDYKIVIRSSEIHFRENSIKYWNLLPFEMKILPMNLFNKGLSTKWCRYIDIASHKLYRNLTEIYST